MFKFKMVVMSLSLAICLNSYAVTHSSGKGEAPEFSCFFFGESGSVILSAAGVRTSVKGLIHSTGYQSPSILKSIKRADTCCMLSAYRKKIITHIEVPV